jgi:hypothetical protein
LSTPPIKEFRVISTSCDRLLLNEVWARAKNVNDNVYGLSQGLEGCLWFS